MKQRNVLSTRTESLGAYSSRLRRPVSGLTHREGPWRYAEHVEWATLTYVDWFNTKQCHGEIGVVAPAMFEAACYDRQELAEETGLEMIKAL